MNAKQTPKTLKQLVVGDVVMLRCEGRLTRPVKIERLTATQLLAGDQRFNRGTGYGIGGNSFFRSYVYIPREGDVEKATLGVRALNIANRIRGIDWSKYPIETLEKIIALI